MASGCSHGYFNGNFVSLCVIVLTVIYFCKLTEGNNGKTFMRNNFNQDQASRNYYPANYKRFRRGYGIKDDTDASKFTPYQQSAPSDGFGTFRKNSPAIRKGGTRNFGNRNFPAYGGPDAFLSSGINEDEGTDDDGSFRFGGSSPKGLPYNGNDSPWVNSSPLRSKGVKNVAAGNAAPPATFNFGNDKARFNGGSKFSFASGGSSGFGGSSASGSSDKSFYNPFARNNRAGSFPGGESALGPKSFPQSISKPINFGLGNGNFPIPSGFGYGKTGEDNIDGSEPFNFKEPKFPKNIDDLTGGNLYGPLKNLNGIDINALLAQIETTTPKKPMRVISNEDKNKVFSGGVEYNERFLGKEKMMSKELQDAISKGFLGSSSSGMDGCKEVLPPTPANSKIKCTSHSGCKIDCLPNYATILGETRLYLVCKDGQWVVKGGSSGSSIPDCQPVCNPQCSNQGICVQPNVCLCSDLWEGPTCQQSKKKEKKCSMESRPSPKNSKLSCRVDKCLVRCDEGYDFTEGIVKLSLICRNGEWAVTNPLFDSVPDCRPVCDSPCLHGGVCIMPNQCQCTEDYRGPQCQYPISNCDPVKLKFNGYYECDGLGNDFGCVLTCPQGFNFTFASADFYSCEYETGNWYPFPIPICDYGTTTPTTQMTTTASASQDHQQKIIKRIPKAGTCYTWMNSHYKTFDGRIYSFKSSCPYTLLQDSVLGTFSLSLIPNEGCKEGSDCPKALKLFTEGDEYLLQSSLDGHPSITYKDTSLAIPGQINGMVSERVAHFVVVKLAGIGLTIKWDLKDLFIAEVSELHWDRTAGLCGRLDGTKENDLDFAEETSYEASLTTFLSDWKATTVGEPCDEPPEMKPRSCLFHHRSAKSFCSQLKRNQKFELCRKLVDVDAFIEACTWDFCSGDGGIEERSANACNTFSAFFRECTILGGAVQLGWRSNDLCPMKCPNGFEYKACMPAIKPRCGQAADAAKPEFCVEGCDCPAGLVNHKGSCIDPDRCPCTYHNKTYTSGDTIPNDCNSCTCLSGQWVCTEVKCGARCSSVGDPHYTTFDGKKYDFMGKCSYYLVKGGDFSIEAENVACAGAISEAMKFPSSTMSQFPSCTKSVTVRVPGTTVQLKQGREVTLNGMEERVLPVWKGDIFIKAASSLFVTATLPNGIEVWWDGHTRAYIDAPASLRGLTAGLCGTFNDNQKDDFITPEGDVEQNPVAFANKWKAMEKCKDVVATENAHPCDRHAQNKNVAEKYCAKLKSHIFAQCHLEVDTESYYKDCLYDLCSCEADLKDCLCPILASYGKECTRKGIVIDWRSKVRQCGVHCKGGQTYQVCGNSCGYTCYDYAANPDCKRKCVDGCNCQQGFTLDVDGVCIPISKCPCMYDEKEYKPGYEMFQKQDAGIKNVCTCKNAAWDCRDPTNIELGSPEFFNEPQTECERLPNEMYTDCLPGEQATCQTMHLRPESPPDVCRAGCRCQTGFVRDPDTHKCIRYSECPCHHGGKSYTEGETIIEECNTCACRNGVWDCTDALCPGICSAWGDSHYKTFDGRMFDFHGTCDYMLAKGRKLKKDNFEISIQNVPCGTDGVTCAKSLTLRVGRGDDQEVVQFSRNKQTKMENMTRTIIREAGVFIFAEVSDMGLVLQWDKGTRAYVTLDPTWRGKVKGLCGNYNEDEKDDFMTPSGGAGEVSPKIFGDSWRLQSYCPESVIIKDTCQLHPHRKVWAVEKCAILKSENFSPCHSEVPVEDYVERCQFDSCGCDTGGDCHCLCTAIAAYAHECNMHGVYIKWRRPDLCPMQCDESCEHYEPCIPTCPLENCDSYLEPQSTLCRQDACVEGCAKNVCPVGSVHKSNVDHECVSKFDCGKKCLKINGKVYLEGEVISQDNCHTCHCTRKSKKCTGNPCTTIDTFTTTPKPRIYTPDTSTTTKEDRPGCRSGWTHWINSDHPIFYKKNSDFEPVPDAVSRRGYQRGYCNRDMFASIRCRTVGDQEPAENDVKCNLSDGLVCQGSKVSKGKGRPRIQCVDYEIQFLCDCSIIPAKTTTKTTPATPTAPPPIFTPSIPPIPEVPDSCDANGWTEWMNENRPDEYGEFETVDDLRAVKEICPNHYIKEVECRPVGGHSSDPDAVICDKKGAMCRNNAGDQNYCKDFEIRVFCQCRCQDGLGMEDYRILDKDISASSSKSSQYGPENGRLNNKYSWVPNLPDWESEDPSSEWLQVDLLEKKEVTGIITQGNHWKNFVKTFAVQISETGSSWDDVKEWKQNFAKTFRANTDATSQVTNLFPEPVYARYVRIIPLSFQSSPALQIELKGCDIDPTITHEPIIPTPTAYPEVCEHGWTSWMNSHIPSPSDWNDIENYGSLRMKFSFCEDAAIQRVDCRIRNFDKAFDKEVQLEVLCNKNLGLQCIDELQLNTHCYDYEIRFLCDCGQMTTTTPSSQICDPRYPNEPHESDCQKFYQCDPNRGLVEKECGPGTVYNPNTFVCDFLYNVIKIRPECGGAIHKSTTTTTTTARTTTAATTEEPCTDHEWTQWFNASHPDGELGDFETFNNIRAAGYDVCESHHILDIECQFYEQIGSSTTSKGWQRSKGRKGSKGRRKKGRPVPDRLTGPVDYRKSKDLGVTCSIYEGLICLNNMQRGGRKAKCHDYAIRVQCSCESRRSTTPVPVVDGRDISSTTVLPIGGDACAPGVYYEEDAMKCSFVCHYHKKTLRKTGKCKTDDSMAPMCEDTHCPLGYFLSGPQLCELRLNCNCMLPNGRKAKPNVPYIVAECEICTCVDNQLNCDKSKCVKQEPTDFCEEGSPWMSVSSPSGDGDDESIDALFKYNPSICATPSDIECRDKQTKKSPYDLGQIVTCEPELGLICKNSDNEQPCEDYEVKLYCDCDKSGGYDDYDDYDDPTTTTTTHKPMDCTEVGLEERKCAIQCDRICLFDKHFFHMRGECEDDSGCGSVCLPSGENYACSGSYFWAGDIGCVSISKCSCRNPFGKEIPAGKTVRVSDCTTCTCIDNTLECTSPPGCTETDSRFTSTTIDPLRRTTKKLPGGPPAPYPGLPGPGEREKTTPPVPYPGMPGPGEREKTTPPVVQATPPPFSCDEWTPYFNTPRTHEGDFESIASLVTQYKVCEKPVNISCREHYTKADYTKLGEILICDTTKGLVCKDNKNKNKCHEYEVSLFCECPEGAKLPTTTPMTTTTTTTAVACEAWSPWINEHKPYLEDGDTEYKSLEQLRDQFSFCTEGRISDIECAEYSGLETIVDKNYRCDPKYGLRCKNEEQARGICADFKIRYYCTCEPTSTRIIITTPVPTAPSVCDLKDYVHLLKDLDDSAFSAPSSAGKLFSPSNARLNDRDSGVAWIPKTNKDQYLKIDLGKVLTIYGVIMGAAPPRKDRVTLYNVLVSSDTFSWSYASDEPLRGPIVNTEKKVQIFEKPVEGRYVRIVPKGFFGNIVVNLELIGCKAAKPEPIVQKPILCEDSMGMENGALSDDQITVSSVFRDQEFYGKSNIRLNKQASRRFSAGAWIANPSSEEYVRFNFMEQRKISGIITQGREGAEEWVESYTVRYSPDGVTWNDMMDSSGQVMIYDGNYDSTTSYKNMFDLMIEAQFLEIRPESWHMNIAMRIEILGCFYAYPKITTTVMTTSTTPEPPPPYCPACPGLPKDLFNRCTPCQFDEGFDGFACVKYHDCPCFHDGNRYQIGTRFETRDCKECKCDDGGEVCLPKKCQKCQEPDERPYVTATCTCVCKPCPEGERLCHSNDFCLEDSKWCDGIEHCHDDEINCPPAECEIPTCIDEWEPRLKEVADNNNKCPVYKCQPITPITKPMDCPQPGCPPKHNIILVPRKLGELCPTYKCEHPNVTTEVTCPPPNCPKGYVVTEDFTQFAQQSQTEIDTGCPQYKCHVDETGTTPSVCPPVVCNAGYEVRYNDASQLIITNCPEFECVPIITTTSCPRVACPDGLQVMYVQTAGGGGECEQFTCIKIPTTTPVIITESTIPDCPAAVLPVCSEKEERYQENPGEKCPIFKCRSVSSATTGPPPSLPMTFVPRCEIVGRDFTTFDGSQFQFDPCHHVLARDKVHKHWQVSVHRNCSGKAVCDRSLNIVQNKKKLSLTPELQIVWDEHTYSVAQAQRIGESTGEFSVSRIGRDSLLFTSKMYNFSVEWDIKMDIEISLDRKSRFLVDGLCGFYTGSPEDDKTKPDGRAALSTQEFGDAWAVEGKECDEPQKSCSVEENLKALKLCDVIESKSFKECHDVLPPSSFMKGCVDRLCLCLKTQKSEAECRCNVLATYVTSCLEKKPDAKIANWRAETKCYKECPHGEIHHDCYKSSCEKSCESLRHPDSCEQDESSGICVSGCFCEPGLVRKEDVCVLPENCRDCICEGYGDPHYKTFDRRNFTFNGECSYVAARETDPTGQYTFQVIARNKRCQMDPITVCTESVKVIYGEKDVEVQLLPTDVLVGSVGGKMIQSYPLKESWLAVERPDDGHILLIIPDIQLELSYSKDNYGFTLRLPSHSYFDKLEGLCGNCNGDKTDDFRKINGESTNSVEEFGLSWLIDEQTEACKVFDKEAMPCVPPAPHQDPCLKLMDEEIFEKCHHIEDPVAYVSSCQLDLCTSKDTARTACQSLEAYARRCSQLGICLAWRSDDLCPINCPAGFKHAECRSSCVKTCDNYKDDSTDCQISPSDGCYCEEGTVMDEGRCVKEAICAPCDTEGHRFGDVWHPDSCTTCECDDTGTKVCKKHSCPSEPICDEGYEIKEVPDSSDVCCGPRFKCKMIIVLNCADLIEPEEDCGYGQRRKIIEAPGVCPEYACVCVDKEDCPELFKDESNLKHGEMFVLDEKGCCPKYVTECTGICPAIDCAPFYHLFTKPLEDGQCCNELSCNPPKDACIYEPKAEEFEFQQQAEIPEKKLYKVTETWKDGVCIDCECVLDNEKKPTSKCLQKSCPSLDDHPDKAEYLLQEVPLNEECCPKVVRTACIVDGDFLKLGETYYDPANGCRSVECVKKSTGVIEKVEQISSCDTHCSLAWEYKPSSLYPQVCCGGCEQVACDFEGQLKKLGDEWLAEDFCTEYKCVKSDTTGKITLVSKEIQCQVPTEKERELYVYVEQTYDWQCCPVYTRTSCLLDGNPLQSGQEISDPTDKCFSYVCEANSDGNVTRREKEQSCVFDCPLGQTYVKARAESPECCGQCYPTECVDRGELHPVGDKWENKDDICYQYSCQIREEVLATVLVKKPCPYFDPDCPVEELLTDPTGCCQICNITKETKMECEPEVIDPKETIGMFSLTAKTVGKCSNTAPVVGFKRCRGQCDSHAEFVTRGISPYLVKDCDCCHPYKFSEVTVRLHCPSIPYDFDRIFTNIDACECRPCETNGKHRSQNDAPILDDTEFSNLIHNDDIVN